jgi:hypothetical protein
MYERPHAGVRMHGPKAWAHSAYLQRLQQCGRHVAEVHICNRPPGLAGAAIVVVAPAPLSLLQPIICPA